MLLCQPCNTLFLVDVHVIYDVILLCYFIYKFQDLYMHVGVLELRNKLSHVHNKQNHAQSTKATRTHCTPKATAVYKD